MLSPNVAAIAILALAAAARAEPTSRDAAPKRPGAQVVADVAAPAEYQLEPERLLAQADRAARARQAGRAATDLDGKAPAACRLQQRDADAATSRDCLRCHPATGRDDHPVDVDYDRARSARGSGLRPLAEVVRSGVLLPDGQVRCVTCHDGRSPWKYRIALPPGAPARPALNPRDRGSYEGRTSPATPLPAGSEVTARPLCLACHSFD